MTDGIAPARSTFDLDGSRSQRFISVQTPISEKMEVLAAHDATTAPREDDSRLTVDTAVAVDINDDDGSEGTAVLNVTMDLEPGQGAVSRDG